MHVSAAGFLPNIQLLFESEIVRVFEKSETAALLKILKNSVVVAGEGGPRREMSTKAKTKAD
jgi:hypothetical protein